MKNNSQLLPDSEGSKFMAWQPNLGLFDIRWAASLEPERKTFRRFDTDLDLLLDLDQRYLI